MCMTEMMFKQNAATMDRMVSAAGWKAAYSHDSSIVYGHGRAVQVHSINDRVDSDCGFSA